MSLTKYISLFLVITLYGSAPLYAAESDVARTWLYGSYTIPGDYTSDGETHTIEQDVGETIWTEAVKNIIKPGVKVPVVVYLHGCKGFGVEGEKYRKFIISEKMGFFMLDSFQRPGREKCRWEGSLQHRVGLRKEEIANAIKQINNLSWVDHGRLVLMGWSEGGNAVDNWNEQGFSAHIILSSACTLVGGSPAAPTDIPVLAIVGENDKYRPGQSCNINRSIGGSRSISIPGVGHRIASEDETFSAIKTFLAACCSGDE